MTDYRSTLDELLSDPMIQLVMKSDRVEAHDVRVLFGGTRERPVEDAAVPPAHVIARMCGKLGLCA